MATSRRSDGWSNFATSASSCVSRRTWWKCQSPSGGRNPSLNLCPCDGKTCPEGNVSVAVQSRFHFRTSRGNSRLFEGAGRQRLLCLATVSGGAGKYAWLRHLLLWRNQPATGREGGISKVQRGRARARAGFVGGHGAESHGQRADQFVVGGCFEAWPQVGIRGVLRY